MIEAPKGTAYRSFCGCGRATRKELVGLSFLGWCEWRCAKCGASAGEKIQVRLCCDEHEDCIAAPELGEECLATRPVGPRRVTRTIGREDGSRIWRWARDQSGDPVWLPVPPPITCNQINQDDETCGRRATRGYSYGSGDGRGRGGGYACEEHVACLRDAETSVPRSIRTWTVTEEEEIAHMEKYRPRSV